MNNNNNRAENLDKEELKNRDTEEFGFLKGITDQELDDLLESATDDLLSAIDENRYDEEASLIIEAVMDEFERRDPGDFVMSDEEVQASLERLYERARAEGIIIDRGGKTSGKRKYRALTVVAASMLFLFLSFTGLSIVADADQYNIWNKFVGWSRDTFNWGDDKRAVPMQDELKNNRAVMHPKIEMLNAALKENGLQIRLPTWMPERYAPVGTGVDIKGSTKVIVAWYEDDGEYFSISVSELPDEESSVQSSTEENAEGGEVYTVAGNDYYITSNESRYSAVSQQDSVWIKIQGALSYDEIISMVDSI